MDNEMKIKKEKAFKEIDIFISSLSFDDRTKMLVINFCRLGYSQGAIDMLDALSGFREQSR
jgi:hypothetical protein